MSLFNRLTTWVSGQLLKSSDLNGEFNNLVNGLNNLDGATTAWDNIKTGALTSTTSTALKGTGTNDSAGTGNYGEYAVNTDAGGGVNFGSTTVISDAGSLTLTAGDWDLTVQLFVSPNGATMTTYFVGLSTTSGNSATGLVIGDNRMDQVGATSTSNSSATIANFRASLSAASTTYFVKIQATYSAGGPPKCSYRFSARRIR